MFMVSGNLLQFLRNGLATGSFDESALPEAWMQTAHSVKKIFGLW